MPSTSSFSRIAFALTPLLASLLLTLIASGCHGSLVHRKPDNPELNEQIDQLWAREIRRVARDGDWILTRSYSKTGDLIVGLTKGESLSHAVMYDASRGTVIEAIRPVVREVPLEQLLRRNRYAVVVRPVDQSPEAGRRALARARSALGAAFDEPGLVGFGSDDRFYCSELVAWASQFEHGERVITPAELFEAGELIYLSGAREDAQVGRAARVSQSRHRAESQPAAGTKLARQR